MLDIEEIIAAINGLTTAELARIRRHGNLLALGLRCTGDDLIQEAMVAAVTGRRNCRRDLPIVVFLIGAMRSIASAARNSASATRPEVSLDATGTDGKPLVVITDSEPDAEAMALRAEDVAQRIAALEELFADDEPAMLVIWGDLEELSKEEIMSMNDLSETAYDTIRRRIRRKIERRFPNGWIA